MMIMVCCAFFHSTGLNAGTPLATASVPVMAEQPSAKALQSRNRPMVSAGNAGQGLDVLTWGSWPVSERNTPTPMSSSIEPMKM